MDNRLLQYIPEFREAWERSQKATPGPWQSRDWTHPLADTGDYTHGDEVFVKAIGGTEVVAELIDGYFADADDPENQATYNFKFIAHSRTDLPTALTALAETRAATAAMLVAIKVRLGTHCDRDDPCNYDNSCRIHRTLGIISEYERGLLHLAGDGEEKHNAS